MTTNSALWWIVPEETFLKKLPSRKQLTVQQDLRTRQSIYDFTIRLGLALKVSGKTILAATVYVARFYIRMPITTSKYYVVCAALSILCKVNDNYRPPDKIALVAAQIKNPNKTVDEHSEIFWTWRDQLLYREELLLRNLNFELNLELPYELRETLLESAVDVTSKSISKSSDPTPPTSPEHRDPSLTLEDPLVLDIDIENDPLAQQPHSPLQNLEPSNNDLFISLLESLTKDAIVLVEILALLPILVSYTSNVFFAVALVLTVNTNEEISHIPPGYLLENICDVEQCYKCYKYIYKLLKLGDISDPQMASNRLAAKKVPLLDRVQFFALADPKNVS